MLVDYFRLVSPKGVVATVEFSKADHDDSLKKIIEIKNTWYSNAYHYFQDSLKIEEVTNYRQVREINPNPLARLNVSG